MTIHSALQCALRFIQRFLAGDNAQCNDSLTVHQRFSCLAQRFLSRALLAQPLSASYKHIKPFDESFNESFGESLPSDSLMQNHDSRGVNS
eukprot:16798-Heterococcus_DN1.PRE.2